MNSWVEEHGTVLANTLVDLDVYSLTIGCQIVAGLALPGQFVMVSGWSIHPLLPRAMAPIRFDAAQGTMTIYYRVIGLGTQKLSRLRSGDDLKVLGPLGKSFSLNHGPLALIGRGVGITPLLPLAEAATSRGLAIRTYLSARTGPLILEEQRFRQLGPLAVHVANQTGDDARVTERLAIDLTGGFRPHLAVVAGSKRLAKHVAQLAHQFGFLAQAFVEEKMACGVGYCKGCAIGVEGHLICIDGPGMPVEAVLAND